MDKMDELIKAVEVAAINYFDFVTTHDTVNRDAARLKADELSLDGSNARAALRAEFERVQLESETYRSLLRQSVADNEVQRVEYARLQEKELSEFRGILKASA